MSERIAIGVIGDFNPANVYHQATGEAIQHAARHLSLDADVRWLPTPSLLEASGQAALEQCHGLWAAPSSPYRSREGAYAGIRFARERGRPFIGT